jgi:iron complex outermembrane receptor protein
LLMSAKTLLSAVLCAVFSLSLLTAYGQDRTITGKVVDSKDGSPVAGASVQPKGTRTGTSTRPDGTFSITVGSNVNTLVITSVGYETQEVSIAGTSTVDVSFVPSAGANLNEVVVTGYGTARRKDLTGSIASVQAKDFNKGVATAPDQLIQGKVAGVQILNNNGAPGAGSTIRIRGANSIRGGNNPLFVVDGIPLDYTSVESGFNTGVGNTPGSNPLNFMNPADIASIDVMKDASAAAIYGARGANGVVLITTKRSLSGQPSLDVNASVGVASVMRKIDILTGDEYRAALTKYGLTSGNFGGNVDALDELLQTAVVQNYSIAVGGGNDNARYRFSTSYQNEEGIIPETGFKKITGNLTSNFKFLESKKLGLDIRLLASHTNNQLAPITNDAGFQQSVIGTALQWNPTHPLRKPNDSIWVVDPALGATTINPLAFLAAWDVYGNTTNIMGNFQPYFKFNDKWEYRMLYGVVRESGITRGQIARWLNQQGIENRGIAGIFQRELTTHQLTHTLNYNGKISTDLGLNALLGYEYRKTDIRGSGHSGQDFDDNGINYYDQLQAATTSSRGMFSYADPLQYLQSYFGRFAFNYREKMHFTATLRADGSSKFGENNKYGYFPSFGAAWTLSNESFIQNMGFFDYLKLRVGWGITGNQEFPGGASLASISITGPGATQFNNFANPDLQWEKVKTTDIGLDFTVWNNRLSGSIEYFKKITTDPIFLVTVPQPGPQGARYWKNLDGEVNNNGIEVTLNAGLVRNDNFTWNIGANATFLENEVTGLGDAVYETGGLHGQGISGATSQRIVNNRPLNVYYLRIWEGIDKTTGQSVYTDEGSGGFYPSIFLPSENLDRQAKFTLKGLLHQLHGIFGPDGEFSFAQDAGNLTK